MAFAVIGLLASSAATGASWPIAEQPDLKQALEQAPVLQTESLGEPARGVNVWERWMVPNLNGKSWDVLQIYFKEYYGPTWLFAIDLGTGQVKNQRLADGHQFYLSGRALGFDGKYYIATPWRQTWSMDLFVYDPETNTLEGRGEIVHGLGGEVRPLVTGPDGRIYGTGTRGNRLGLYIYDPKLGNVVKDFGSVGPSHPNGAWSRYVMGVDDTHAYIASGMIPEWYLVAVNLETGEEKVLLESPTERVMDIIEHFPGAFARIPQGNGAPDKEYWLYHGAAILMTNSAPPWPKKTSPWDKAVARPEVYFDQIDPDAEGNAVLWYRSRDKAEPEQKPPWKSIRLTGVPTYPHRLNPLSVLPNGRLYGTGDDYAGTFIFDPKTDQTTYCGPRTGLAPYTTIVCGGKLYLSGYSGGHLFVFDPARDGTLGKGGPPGEPAPDQGDARSNPRYLGDFDRATRVGLMHSSALGADGKIYFGGFGLRHYTGGGLGWYDPKAQKMGGLWQSLSGHAVQWIAPVLDGRLIVISTIRAADELNNNGAPQQAKLFVFDVNEQKITREIVPLTNAPTTGLITEVAPGRLLGLTADRPQSSESVLYGVDVASGEVLFTKRLPAPVSTDAYWPHWVDPSYEYHAFAKGPDRCVWSYLKNVLVRIDPEDARVHVVGKLDPVGWPTFVGRDVYLSGSEQLRRIRNLAPEKYSRAPYSHSELIQGIDWHWDTYTSAAPGSDLWPVTWGPDDQLYAAWGDGGGFGGTDSDGRVAMGFARIEGTPEHWRGFNVNGGKNPEHPASFERKSKTTGLAFVEGVLYATVNLEDGTWPNVNHVLAWSTNNGATWNRAEWLFPRGEGNFQPAKFVEFGKDYTGLPTSLAGYVYVCGPRQSAEPGSGNRLYLTRAPQTRLRDRAAYEFYGGVKPGGVPAWVADIAQAQPIFVDPNGVTPGAVVYDPGLKRFLLTCFHVGPGQLGVFEAPNPWGPWAAIAYYEDWGGMGSKGEGLTCGFPQKWMTTDGLTLRCIFSVYGDGAKQGVKAHDRFNLVKARLQFKAR